MGASGSGVEDQKKMVALELKKMGVPSRHGAWTGRRRWFSGPRTEVSTIEDSRFGLNMKER